MNRPAKQKEELRVPVTAPLLIAAVLLLLKLSQFLMPRDETLSSNIFLALIIIQIIVFVLPSIVYYYSIDRKLQTPMLVRLIRPSHLIFIVFVIIMFISGNMLLKFLMYFISDGVSAGDSSLYNPKVLTDGGNKLYIFLTFALMPAVCEELFFRGVVLSEYRSLGSANAVIVSALTFSMVHFSYDNFIVYFFAGLVFGFAAIVTRSVFTPMLLHMINNVLNLYIDDSFLRLMMRESGTFFVAFVLILLFGISAIIVLSRTEAIFHNYAERPPAVDQFGRRLPPNSRNNFARVFLSPAFLALLGVFIIITGFGS